MFLRSDFHLSLSYHYHYIISDHIFNATNLPAYSIRTYNSRVETVTRQDGTFDAT